MAYLGCCNIPHYPMALDPVRDLAYVQANGELFGANMSTGALSARFSGAGDSFGMMSIADRTRSTRRRERQRYATHPVNGRQWLRVDRHRAASARSGRGGRQLRCQLSRRASRGRA